MVANILQYRGLDGKFFTRSPQTLLGTIPFFHAFGLNHIVHTTIYYGVPLYVMPRFDLEKFCQTIEKYKITYTCLVPPMVLLLAQSPIVQKYDLSTVKSAICGAAPLGPDLVADLKAVLPNLTIKQGYGLTETSPAAILEPTDKVVSGKYIYCR
jgi:acyl-CoA synthetase (AMP-forming)/AMP-acid ligase II